MKKNKTARPKIVSREEWLGGPFEQGQQVWIVDRDGSKVGATVENVS
jgi:hypothetical protein